IEARRQEREARRQEEIARGETAVKEQALAAEAERGRERDAALAREVLRVRERDAALEDSRYQLDTGNFLVAAAAFDRPDSGLTPRRLDSIRPNQRGWEWQYLHRQAAGGIFTVDAGGIVLGVAFSPDGTRFAAAGYNHKPRVWDARTGVLL